MYRIFAASSFLVSISSLIYIYRLLRLLKRPSSLSIVSDTEKLVNNTPMLFIKSLSRRTKCQIYGKAEFLSLTGSPKGRIALAMIEHAEGKGLIKPNTGCTIFEGTVGSTGIALATIAKIKGYSCHIVMPDDQSREKYEILEALDAKVERVRPCSIIDPNHYVNVARQRAAEMNTLTPFSAYFCDQFENPINISAHFTTTGPEIYTQMDRAVDYFVMGAGTGGTLSGVSKFMLEKLPGLRVVLADPHGSGLYNKVKFNIMYASTEQEGKRKRHQVDTIVEGMGINRNTRNFDFAYSQGFIHDAVQVTDQEAVDMAKYMVKEEGLFLGSTACVNLVAAVKTAVKCKRDSRIVTILCDSGSRHLTKFWNAEYLTEQGLQSDGNIDYLFKTS